MTDDPTPLAQPGDNPEAHLLALVRYGLGKEIRLYPDTLMLVEHEEGEVNKFSLDNIRRLVLQPGERIPSKLILIIELEDGTAVIAGEGMTNVRDFRHLLPILQEHAPHIALDPPDMDAQLAQALVNRRQASVGCYGVVLVAVLLIVLVCVLGNLLHH